MNILVTGATKGIGKAIALKLVEADFCIGSAVNLFVAGRNEELLKLLPAKAYCVCDLSQDSSKLEEFIITNNIDVLVNNAGTYIYSEISNMKTEDIHSVYMTNLISPTNLIKAAVSYMKNNKWGRIVNIGSISGVMGEANASIYSASKAGLLGLTKALALELAEFNITVNTINPGWVDTDLGNESIEESAFSKEEIMEGIPQRRFVRPEEVASLVKYLISEDAKGITGQGINLCAGLSVGI